MRWLVDIYQLISSSADRARVRPIIFESCQFYAKDLTVLVDEVQEVGVAYTKVPGMALSGSKLRDELRQLATLFEHPELPN